MLSDHVGRFVFPEIAIFRVFGGLAFPLFAYQLIIGYFKTSNILNYVKRLLIFALISQGPYMLFFGMKLNIFFTLIFGIMSIVIIENKRYFLLFPVFLLSMFSSGGIVCVLFILLLRYSPFYRGEKLCFIPGIKHFNSMIFYIFYPVHFVLLNLFLFIY